MFTPLTCRDECLVPLQDVDVVRYTKTISAEHHEMQIEDIWDGSANDTTLLSDMWLGEFFSASSKEICLLGMKWFKDA